MSFMPDDDDKLAYVSKATFTHLWEKFKQTEQALAQSDTINHSLASNVLRLGNECRDQGEQVKALKEELARVMEDLHRTNDVLAGHRADMKWMASCLVTRRSLYEQHILAIANSVCNLADVTPSTARSQELWKAYEKAMAEASALFSND
jgi:nitrate reductase assembly molybdenum cofactor insertion protein NarJ